MQYDYNASQKQESTLLQTYVLNKFLTAERSSTVWSSELLALLIRYGVKTTK